MGFLEGRTSTLDMQVDPILAVDTARSTSTVITISTVDIDPLIGISKPHCDDCKQSIQVV
ncbi:hypothetical protein N7465_006018 [Penicillium sp. CMV-2018d]|nr:hypothetical protein N7465_006018 [Penicillium sp. CMV-2018d]